MNLIAAMYSLEVNNVRFLKQIYVQRVPLKGEYLKVKNINFVVVEVEQDIDAYTERDYEAGSSCESVRAVINKDCYDERDYETIKKSLIEALWQKY